MIDRTPGERVLKISKSLSIYILEDQHFDFKKNYILFGDKYMQKKKTIKKYIFIHRYTTIYSCLSENRNYANDKIDKVKKHSLLYIMSFFLNNFTK